jgi:hypothetical protein
MPVAEGTEILLFDRGRRPSAWTEAIAPSQYAVFLTDLETTMPCSSAGVPQAAAACTCTVFDSLDAAERFANECVRRFPRLRCDVFDAEGRALPPLLVITHPDRRNSIEAAGPSPRWRWMTALVLILASGPLVWIDWHNDFQIIVPTLLGFTCAIAAVRLIHWEIGVRSQERERRRRLDECRRRERQG